MKKIVPYAIIFNSIIFFSKINNVSNPNYFWIKKLFFIAFIDIATLYFILNKTGIPEFFSMKAMRMVDATPVVVVNFIGWVLLIVQTGIAVLLLFH